MAKTVKEPTKWLAIFLFSVVFVSCKTTETANQQPHSETYIKVDGKKYYRIKVGNHDMYQYTKNKSSDIIHLDYACDFCRSRKGN